MDQDALRKLGDNEAVKNELVKQFTQHLLEPSFPDDSVVKVKMVVLGPMRSGKTSWVTRVTMDEFNSAEAPTVGAKFSSQGVAIDETEYQFEIWDVSGEEWCRALCPMYLQHAHAAVICYDPSEEESFEEAKEWVQYTKKQGDRDLIIALVGTKSDLSQIATLPVKNEDVFTFFVNDQSLEQEFLFPAVSNKTGENVQDVILSIAEAFHERGVKVPRESVMRDADKEFETIVDKGVEAKDILTKNDPTGDDDAEKCKSRFEKFSESLKKGATACFDSSKKGTQRAYESTRVAGAKMARNSKKFSTQVQERSRRLIRKLQDKPPAGELSEEEVAPVPASVPLNDTQGNEGV